MDIGAKTAKEKPQKSNQRRKKITENTTSSQTMTEVNLNQIIIFLTSKFVTEVIFCVCEYCEICAFNIVI